MNLTELKQEITKEYNKILPNSKIRFMDFTVYHKNINNEYVKKIDSITVRCFLAKDQSECINNYFDNDMFNISFNIKFKNNIYHNTDILQDMILINYNKSYLIKPDNQYMAYSRTMLAFRKTEGDAKKIIKALSKFFSNLKTSLTDDYNNNVIHDNHIELLKAKLNL